MSMEDAVFSSEFGRDVFLWVGEQWFQFQKFEAVYL